MRNLFVCRFISLPALLLALLLPVAPAAFAAEPTKIPMTADKWTTTGPVEFVQDNGVAAINLKSGNYAEHIPSGQAVLNDLVFSNGTVEYDVEATAGMGAGFGFRRADKDNFEDFYLRPRPNCDQAPDCIQYAPETHGVLLWDVYPQYQGPASLKLEGWNHIKLVISGSRMNIFINGAQQPAMKIGRLEGDTHEGGLVLQGPGIFANLTVIPDATEGLPPAPEKDPLAGNQRYVRDWQLSPFSKLDADKEPTAADIPASSANWQPLAAERGGLVNISRVYGLPLPRPDYSIAWLRTSIHSDKDQTRKVDFGFVREAWVFVNGKLVYADKNLYQPPTARKSPDGRCSLDNGSFSLPLKAGDNEVDVAVATNFYGWAILFRLDDTKGVHLAQR